MASFLSELRNASVEIDGVTYPLDDFPTTYIDGVRRRVGDFLPDIIDDIVGLGYKPDTAPDTVAVDVCLRSGRVVPLTEYSDNFLDWLRRHELASDASDNELANYLEETDRAPEECPAEVIDLNCQGGVWIVPGDAPADRSKGLSAMDLVGFVSSLVIDIMPNGDVDWWTTDGQHPAYINGPSRVEWCLRECRGPWLIMTGDYLERSEEWALHILMLNSDDQRRFDTEFPFDVRGHDPRPAMALKAKEAQ